MTVSWNACEYQQGSCTHHGSVSRMSGWQKGLCSYQDMSCCTPRTPCCVDNSWLWRRQPFSSALPETIKEFCETWSKQYCDFTTRTVKCALTAKGFVPPLLGHATWMDTLSGELWEGFADEGVPVVFRIARISHTDSSEGVHIQKILATTECSSGEDLLTKFLKARN